MLVKDRRRKRLPGQQDDELDFWEAWGFSSTHAKIDDALGAITAIELLNVNCINATCFRCHSVQTYATMRSDSSESRLFFSWTRSIHWSIVSGSEPKTHTQLKQDLFILSRHHTLTPFGFTQPTYSAFWDAYKTVLKEFPCMQGTKSLLNWFHLKKFTCKEQINKCKR